MNAIAQGGGQRVDEFDMKGQHARTNGSTCAPAEGRDAAIALENYNTNAQTILIPPQEYTLLLELIKLGDIDPLCIISPSSINCHTLKLYQTKVQDFMVFQFNT